MVKSTDLELCSGANSLADGLRQLPVTGGLYSSRVGFCFAAAGCSGVGCVSGGGGWPPKRFALLAAAAAGAVKLSSFLRLRPASRISRT